jgi:hypothetical protein
MSSKATVVAGPVSKAGLPTPQPADLLNGRTGDITTNVQTTVIAAQGASTFIYVGQITIQNSHATQGTWVEIRDGGAVRLDVYCAPAGGGAVITFPENAPLRLSVNTALTVAPMTTGVNVRASATGFKATR